jgi:hypothetical protein
LRQRQIKKANTNSARYQFSGFERHPGGAKRGIKKYWAGTFIPALFDEKIYTPAMSELNGAVAG